MLQQSSLYQINRVGSQYTPVKLIKFDLRGQHILQLTCQPSSQKKSPAPPLHCITNYIFKLFYSYYLYTVSHPNKFGVPQTDLSDVNFDSVSQHSFSPSQLHTASDNQTFHLLPVRCHHHRQTAFTIFLQVEMNELIAI